jgi:MFS transporter, DHA1 family, tetracycline resistance protein
LTPASAPAPSRDGSFALILAAAFLNTMGMTVVFPVLPFVVQRYTHSGAETALWVGLLASVFAACAFFAAPVLGAVSDRFGRRPVLIVSLAGSALGFLIFGIGGALWVLLAGRIIDGLTGGNISTIFAYVSDVTAPQDRGRRFGLVGGVMGAGFMIGPGIGGLLSRFGLPAPVFFAAALTALTAIAAAFLLPESLNAEHRRAALGIHDIHPFATIAETMRRPQLRILMLFVLGLTIPMAGLQTNLGVFGKDVLQWGPMQAGMLGFGVGVMDILVQGVLVGKLMPRIGERGIVTIGLIGQGVGYVVIALVTRMPSSMAFAFGGLLFAASEGGTGPAMLSLISRSVSHKEQGWVQGGVQSMNSAARAIGPLLWGVIYASVSHAAPYWIGAGVIAIALAFGGTRLRHDEPAEARAAA